MLLIRLSRSVSVIERANLVSQKTLINHDPGLFISYANNRKTVFGVQKRSISVQSQVESAVKTQSGFFQTLSESTPVSYAQDFLLNIHDTTGLPWWATIIVSTVLLRSFITVPLAIYQHNIIAKVENLKLEMPDIVKELKIETAVAIKKFGWSEREARIVYNRSLKKQWNALIVRDNCHPFKASLLLFVQLPTWICLSVAIRNLVYMLPYNDTQAQLTFLELSMGGLGWIPNLTAIDSTFILPVMLGLINLSIIEVQTLSKVSVPGKFSRYLTNCFRGLSILLIPIAASVPSCLCLYWFTSSAYGLIQNLVLISPKVKRFCRIPQTASELENPYAHILAGVKYKYNSLYSKFKIS